MIWCDSNEYITPKQFLKVVQKYSTIFGDGSQQDSQEFLIFLLDLLHEIMNKQILKRKRKEYFLFKNVVKKYLEHKLFKIKDLNRVKVKPTVEDKDYQSDDYETYAAESWKNYLLRNKSIVVDLFQGQLKSTLKCLQCQTFSHKFDTFMYLSVPLPNDDQQRGLITIEDCIEEFTKEEELDESEWWLCTKCKKRTPSTKKIDLWKTPNILIVHLKRFQYNKNNRGKINNFIDFKITQFDLSRKVSGKEKMKPIYDLFSVCNHSGNLGGGHYTAYAKNRDTQDWYLFDDSKVSSVKNPFKEILSQKAYVLFYSKTSIDKFQRQTISRPEQWPHILNVGSPNQHPINLSELNSNQKKSFSALSIQKQSSRTNQFSIASNSNLPSLKSTPNNYRKQVNTSTLNYLFDDDNKAKEKELNLPSKYQSKMSPTLEKKEQNEYKEIENLDLTEQPIQYSPLIKSNKKQFNNIDKDFMPPVITHSRVGSFSKKQQLLPELKQKDGNTSNFMIRAFPVKDEDSPQKQSNKNQLQNSQDLTPFLINLNENQIRNDSPQLQPTMLKVKKANQKVTSNKKIKNTIDNSFTQKEISPKKKHFRNQSQDDFHNSHQDINGKNSIGNMQFQNDNEISQKLNVSLIPQFDQFSQTQRMNNSSQKIPKVELPKISQNKQGIKNNQNANSLNLKEQNDLIQNFDTSKDSQFYTKNNSSQFIGNSLNRRSVQETYDTTNAQRNQYGLQVNKNTQWS